MIQSLLLISILFTSVLTAPKNTTEKSINYIEIKLSQGEDKTNKTNITTTTSKPTPTPLILPNRIFDEFNEETRRYRVATFKDTINLFIGFIRDRSDSRKCRYYKDNNLNKLIDPERWPERFPHKFPKKT